MSNDQDQAGSSERVCRDAAEAREALLHAIESMLREVRAGDRLVIERESNTVDSAMREFLGGLAPMVKGMSGQVELTDTLTIRLVKTRQIGDEDIPRTN